MLLACLFVFADAFKVSQKGKKPMFVMASSSSFMMTTFKVACNDDEVVVLLSGLEGYIKLKCFFIVCLFLRMLLKCLKKAKKIFVM